MKQVSLSGSLRASVGRKDAAELRKAKRVPAVIYGNGTQTHFHTSYIDMGKIIFTSNVFEVIIDLDGKKTSAIIQEVQLDPVSDKIIHVDFLELVEGKPVKIKLPVSLVGVSRGVRAGGKLSQVFRKLAVVGEKKDLPEAIEINIENLKIGQDVRVRDIKIPGLKFLDPAAAVVVAVKAARGSVADNDDDAEEAPAAEAEKTEAAAE
jgi:large subunit ribosomal protein L25